MTNTVSEVMEALQKDIPFIVQTPSGTISSTIETDEATGQNTTDIYIKANCLEKGILLELSHSIAHTIKLFENHGYTVKLYSDQSGETTETDKDINIASLIDNIIDHSQWIEIECSYKERVIWYHSIEPSQNNDDDERQDKNSDKICQRFNYSLTYFRQDNHSVTLPMQKIIEMIF